VYDKKIAKEVNAYQDSQALSSMYVIEATAAPGQTVDALYNALIEAVKKALAAPPTDAELQRAISAYKKSFYGRIEAVQSRASTISNYFLHTGKGDYLQQDLARYTEATPQKVFEAAKRVIDLDHATRLDIVPGKKEIEPAVAQAATPAPEAKGAAK
jgi:zinc protease